MIAVLEPLHAKLEEVDLRISLHINFGILTRFLRCLQGPQTARETSFAQVFGRELAEAREVCRRYRINGETSELDKAWDIYYTVSPGQFESCSTEPLFQVFKKIEKQLPQLTTLDLQYVSPVLLSIRNLKLAVPGK